MIEKSLTKDLQKVFKKHQCKGYAYAIDQQRITTEVGYGASYPVGTGQALITKLQTIINDIKNSTKYKKELE